MRQWMTVASGLLATFFMQAVQANVQISFVESAPKDRFVIQNLGTCALTDLRVQIDLSTSQGKLIFDTTETGAGVEVFQPFEQGSGSVTLSSSDTVDDGDQQLSVTVAALAPDATASFTIDVDDTMVQSALGQIRVTGSEMQGAVVRLGNDTTSQVTAEFNSENEALLLLPACS